MVDSGSVPTSSTVRNSSHRVTTKPANDFFPGAKKHKGATREIQFKPIARIHFEGNAEKRKEAHRLMLGYSSVERKVLEPTPDACLYPSVRSPWYQGKHMTSAMV